MDPDKLNTAQLKARGFDQSRYDRSLKSYFISCSQCHAIAIQGVACHEHGCPNTKKGNRR